jgi:hypothetical protein
VLHASAGCGAELQFVEIGTLSELGGYEPAILEARADCSLSILVILKLCWVRAEPFSVFCLLGPAPAKVQLQAGSLC